MPSAGGGRPGSSADRIFVRSLAGSSTSWSESLHPRPRRPAMRRPWRRDSDVSKTRSGLSPPRMRSPRRERWRQCVASYRCSRLPACATAARWRASIAGSPSSTRSSATNRARSRGSTMRFVPSTRTCPGSSRAIRRRAAGARPIRRPGPGQRKRSPRPDWPLLPPRPESMPWKPPCPAVSTSNPGARWRPWMGPLGPLSPVSTSRPGWRRR